MFVDVMNNNYEIDSISPAIKQGIPMGVPFDINGVDRGQTPLTLGAYQYVKKNYKLRITDYEHKKSYFLYKTFFLFFFFFFFFFFY